MEACKACCLCTKKFRSVAEKKRKALYGVAAADAQDTLDSLCQEETGQQLNVYIPETSDTGCQLLCHVCEWQLLRERKGVKDVEQQKKEHRYLVSISIDTTAMITSKTKKISKETRKM